MSNRFIAKQEPILEAAITNDKPNYQNFRDSPND